MPDRTYRPKKRKVARSRRFNTPLFGFIALLAAVSVYGYFELQDEGEQQRPGLGNTPINAPRQNPQEQPTKEKIELDQSWSTGMASGYDFADNEGWDQTASGIPLDYETYTVAVDQSESHLLTTYVDLFYEGVFLTAQITDTGNFGQYGRVFDLGPAVWMAFGASTDEEWGVREVNYRYVH